MMDTSKLPHNYQPGTYQLYSLKCYNEQTTKEFHDNRINNILTLLTSLIKSLDNGTYQTEKATQELCNIVTERTFKMLRNISKEDSYEHFHIWNHGMAYKINTTGINPEGISFMEYSLRNILTDADLKKIPCVECGNLSLTINYSIPCVNETPVNDCFCNYIEFVFTTKHTDGKLDVVEIPQFFSTHNKEREWNNLVNEVAEFFHSRVMEYAI